MTKQTQQQKLSLKVEFASSLFRVLNEKNQKTIIEQMKSMLGKQKPMA